MKTTKKILVGLMMLMFSVTLSISPLQTKAQGWVNAQYFYDNLSPYGNWVYYPGYGNVWLPDTPGGFRPYFSSGNWVFTDYGWMWVSDYSWGWATFHYGSWAYDPYYGWMWVPGYRWAPAWVTWGSYSGYYGWAPIGPGYVYGNPYYPPMDYWVFVHPQYMGGPGWHDHYCGYSNNQIVINNNTYITNVNNITIVNNSGNYNGESFNAGPDRASFEKAAARKIDVVSIKDNANPGKDAVSGKEVSIYRPQVNAADKTTAKPSKIVPLESVKHNDAVKINDAGKDNGNAAGKQIVPQQRTDGVQSGKQVVPEQRVNNGQYDKPAGSQQKGNAGQYDKKPGSQQKANNGQYERQPGSQQKANNGQYERQPGSQQKVNTGQSDRPSDAQHKANTGQRGKQVVPANKTNSGNKQAAGKQSPMPEKKSGVTPKSGERKGGK